MPSTRSLIEPYINDRRLVVAASTAHQDSHYIKQFVSFLEGRDVLEVAAITDEHLAEYLFDLRGRSSRRRLGKPLSGNFILRSLGVARQFLVWAREQGHTLADFSSFSLFRVPPKPLDVPSVEQVKRLLEAPCTDTPDGLRDTLIWESVQRKFNMLFVGGLGCVGKFTSTGERSRPQRIRSGLAVTSGPTRYHGF